METTNKEFRVAILLPCTILSALIIAAFGGLYLTVLKSINIAVVCIAAAGFCLLTPLVYRRSGSYSVAVNYLLVTSISVVLYASIYTGRTSSPVLFWITVLPLVGGFLIRDSWSSLKWSCVSL